MKKIMFNDKYGLTQAVLDGRKTMTRRVIKQEVDIARHFNPKLFPEGYDPMAFYRDERGMCRLIDTGGNYIEPVYKIGEVVAVAQSYKDLGYTKEWVEQHISPNPNAKPTDPFEKKYPGWNNKMFTPSELNNVRKIQITDIKMERLQDISDEDCLKEGIYVSDTFTKYGIRNGYSPQCTKDPKEKKWWFGSPREAFAALIDKLSGKGTWNRNDWQFAYTLKLVK